MPITSLPHMYAPSVPIHVPYPPEETYARDPKREALALRNFLRSKRTREGNIGVTKLKF